MNIMNIMKITNVMNNVDGFRRFRQCSDLLSEANFTEISAHVNISGSCREIPTNLNQHRVEKRRV